MVAGVLASLGAVEGMTDDAIEGFEQIIDRLEGRVGIRTVNRRRSRPGLAHPAHAVSNPAAASHRNLSPTVLGWSYTPSIGVTTSTGIVGYHNAARHEPSARPEPVDDAARRSALPLLPLRMTQRHPVGFDTLRQASKPKPRSGTGRSHSKAERVCKIGKGPGDG
jgi:hypothetical protein